MASENHSFRVDLEWSSPETYVVWKLEFVIPMAMTPVR